MSIVDVLLRASAQIFLSLRPIGSISFRSHFRVASAGQRIRIILHACTDFQELRQFPCKQVIVKIQPLDTIHTSQCLLFGQLIFLHNISELYIIFSYRFNMILKFISFLAIRSLSYTCFFQSLSPSYTAKHERLSTHNISHL